MDCKKLSLYFWVLNVGSLPVLSKFFLLLGPATTRSSERWTWGSADYLAMRSEEKAGESRPGEKVARHFAWQNNFQSTNQILKIFRISTGLNSMEPNPVRVPTDLFHDKDMGWMESRKKEIILHSTHFQCSTIQTCLFQIMEATMYEYLSPVISDSQKWY